MQLLDRAKRYYGSLGAWQSLLICWCMCPSLGSKVKNITYGVSRHIRSLGFPEGSGMGIFFALSVPVDIPDKTVLFSYYFEANYRLPNDWNSTYFDEEYLRKRSLDRQLAYDILEKKLDSAGYPGRTCLLRTICEAANYPFAGNGLLGDILRILFMPSSSMKENLPERLIEAEREGNCTERYGECSISLLDVITHYPLEQLEKKL